MHASNLGYVLQNGMRRQIFNCAHPLPSDKEVQYQTVAETSPSNLAEAGRGCPWRLLLRAELRAEEFYRMRVSNCVRNLNNEAA